MHPTLVVFSSDERYFALTKGLVLSLKRFNLEQQAIGLAFLDGGCGEQSLEWLRNHGVLAMPLDSGVLGALAAVPGYHKSQVCRPFLPRFFPDIEVFVWMDVDLWVQGEGIIPQLSQWARKNPEKLFIAPEWHYSYLKLNMGFDHFQLSNFGFYYRALYGQDVTPGMLTRPMLNTGVFAMAAENQLWDFWRSEVETLYLREYPDRQELIRHMAEQIALNVVAYRAGSVIPIDPLYNYMCTWAPPFRDHAGVVRLTLPPYAAPGIVHLSNWKHYRKMYWELGLMFERGGYLSDEDKIRIVDSD